LPGARSVGGTDDPDLDDDSHTGAILVPGNPTKEDWVSQIEEPAVTPAFFATLQIPLVAGRLFNDQDVIGRPNVAIVNVTFARSYFGDAHNAIGRMVGFGGAEPKPDTEIVGVVGDTKHRLRADPLPTAYRPRFQLPEPNSLFFYVRTWQPSSQAVANIRTAMQQLDSRLALNDLRSVDDQIVQNLSAERLIALLSVSFGVLAMLLAGLGLYGVLAYATAQRTREIGIRMALGAQRSGVMRLVLADVLWLVGLSIAITIPVSLFLTRLLRSQLYGVNSYDPLTLSTGTLLVAIVALGAALLPARRAASIEPVQALRNE
jgi:predicted permease